MRTLKAGVIGLGVGEQHVLGYRRHPSCEVVALCDVDPTRLVEIGTRYPEARTTEDPADILRNPDIDVVSIASYDDTHFEQVSEALIHGKHVFVEKPVCLHRHELDRLHAITTEHPELRLSSNLILRMSPRFRALRDELRQGALGEIFYVEGDYDYGRLWKLTEGWRSEIDFYSVVHGGAIHIIDLLCWMLEDRVERVAAFGNRIASRGSRFAYRDLVASILEFETGTVGKVTANFGAVRPHFHRLSIYGTKATFVNRPDEAELFVSRDPAMRPKLVSTVYPGAQKGDLIGSFLDSILSGSPAEVTTNEVFDIMSVCLAIEEAADTGRVVTVRYLKR